MSSTGHAPLAEPHPRHSRITGNAVWQAVFPTGHRDAWEVIVPGEPGDAGALPLFTEFGQDGCHVVGGKGCQQGVRGLFGVWRAGEKDRGVPVPEPVGSPARNTPARLAEGSPADRRSLEASRPRRSDRRWD